MTTWCKKVRDNLNRLKEMVVNHQGVTEHEEGFGNSDRVIQWTYGSWFKVLHTVVGDVADRSSCSTVRPISEEAASEEEHSPVKVGISGIFTYLYRPRSRWRCSIGSPSASVPGPVRTTLNGSTLRSIYPFTQINKITYQIPENYTVRCFLRQ